MHYLGIDIGKEKHVAAMLNTDGQIDLNPLVFKADSAGYQKLLSTIKQDKSSLLIGMEATGHYWLNLYEKLTQDGFRVIVLNPLQVSSFRNQGIRGSKTDTVDALLIAKVLRFGETLQTKIPDKLFLSLQHLTRYRADLIQEAAKAKNKVIALLDQVFPEFQTLFSNIFGSAAIELLKTAATPEEILDLDEQKLISLLQQYSKGRFDKELALRIKETAKDSFGLTTAADTFSLQIKLIISQIEHSKGLIAILDKEIAALYSKLDNHLTTLPGVATTTAAIIIAEIEDITKFKSSSGGAAALVAFAGMDPKLKESGKFYGQVKMSKRGSPYLRRAIYLASFIAVQKDDFFKTIYQNQRQKGKCHKVALLHVGVKMLHIIYSMLKNNHPYISKNCNS